MASGGARDRRAAERLQILMQAATTMLGQLANLSRDLEPRHAGTADELERMPWKDKSLHHAAECMKKRFPEYPSLEGVGEAKVDELRKKPRATAICKALETWYLTLDDTAVLREDVKALLMELADDLELLPGRVPDFLPLAAAFLELFRLYVQITLVLAQIPDKEVLVCFYTYCFQYATDLPVTKFERLSRLLTGVGASQDSALSFLRQEVLEKGPATHTALGEFLTKLLLGVNGSGAPGGQNEAGGVLALYQRYQALCEDEVVMGVGSLLGSSTGKGEEQVQLPSGSPIGGRPTVGEGIMMHLPQVARMREWLALGLLVVPKLVVMEHSRMGSFKLLQTVSQTAATIECSGLRVHLHAELYKVFHDKDFINDYEQRMDKGGFKDAKNAFRDAISTFLSSEAASHRRRRGFLQRCLEASFHVLADCPGLFGPQWFSVMGLLAIARDEIVWYFRHRELPALPSQVKVYKGPFNTEGETLAGALAGIGIDVGGDVAVLIGAMMRLKWLALRHVAVAQRYYRTYLAGALRMLLLEEAAHVSRADPVHQLVELMASQAPALGDDELGLGGGGGVEGFVLDARRALCVAASRSRKGAVKPERALPRVLMRVLHAASVIGGAAEGLREAASLSWLYYWRQGEWKEAYERAMMQRPACAMLMLQALDDWTRDPSALCSAQRCQAVGVASMRQANELLQQLGAEVARQLREMAREEAREQNVGPLKEVRHPHFCVAQLFALLATAQPQLRVYTHDFWPIEYVVKALSDNVMQVVKGSLLSGAELRARQALEQLQHLLSVLRLVDTHAAVPVDTLVRLQMQHLFVDDKCAALSVPLALQAPSDGDAEGRLADEVGRWFSSELLMPDVHMLAGPQQCFASPTRPHVQLERATTESELRALCLLLGPVGVRSVERQLLMTSVEKLRQVLSFIRGAAAHCKKIADEDRGLLQGCVLARLRECPGLEAFGHEVSRLGVLLHFRRSLHSAMGVALEGATLPEMSLQGLPPALRLAVEFTGEVLRSPETKSLDLLAHSLGADSALWPVDAALRAQTAVIFNDEALRRGDFDYAMHALAAFAFAPALKDIKKGGGGGGSAPAVGASVMCAPAALLAVLILCRGGVRGGGSGEAQEISCQVGKLVATVSRSVVHLLSQDKSAKDAALRKNAVLFVERLVEECQGVAPAARRAGMADMFAQAIHVQVHERKGGNSTNVDMGGGSMLEDLPGDQV